MCSVASNWLSSILENYVAVMHQTLLVGTEGLHFSAYQFISKYTIYMSVD